MLGLVLIMFSTVAFAQCDWMKVNGSFDTNSEYVHKNRIYRVYTAIHNEPYIAATKHVLKLFPTGKAMYLDDNRSEIEVDDGKYKYFVIINVDSNSSIVFAITGGTRTSSPELIRSFTFDCILDR